MDSIDRTDRYTIDRVEQLADIYAKPAEGVVKKETDCITPLGRAFIAASPFLILATGTKDGLDCSPKGDAPGFVQVNAATPQTDQSQVSVVYAQAQTAGNTNILAIGWNNTTSNITSVTDSAGNVYELAVPTARGSGLSQAIYYASNIKSAAAGQVQLSPAAAARLMREVRTPEPAAAQPLTDRETDVLKLLAQGKANKEIAFELIIGEKTVKTHVSNILLKLGVQSRTQAALYAAQNGLAELSTNN